MGDQQREWERLESIIDRALELEKDKRVAFIREQTSDDETLRQHALEYLNAIENSEGYLDDSLELTNSSIRDWSVESCQDSCYLDQTIGNYKIVELIEHGGMGSVFLAERVGKEFDQQVAIKLIRRGMDTPSVVARFKREQQILANLRHPHIAQLYDGGITEEGLPYLVMEYIQGMPIDQYCNKYQYPVEKRLELFEQVCRAIHHAHKNLIIHRDLKPSNIFVTDEGHIKILDFGISKILDNENNQSLFQTQEQTLPISLGYAAPEQLQGETITTAVDTYGLGVVLYQLLVDVHPFELEDQTIGKIENIILNNPVPSPAGRFKSLQSEKQKASIASNRSTTPRQLYSFIKGDLGAIVLKTLEKDPNLRYNSTGELLDDLQRFRNNIPIQARQNNIGYVAKKFINRHSKGLATAATFFLMLVGFAAVYTYQIAQERNYAEQEAAKAERISGFLIDVFEENDPAVAQGDTMTVKEVLANAEKTLESLDEEPLIKSNMMLHIGKLYYKLGQPVEAEKMLLEAQSIQDQNSINPTTEQADIARYLGSINMTNYHYDKADTNLSRAHHLYKKLQQTDDIGFVKNMNKQAELATHTGNFDLARRLYDKAIEISANLPETERNEIRRDIYNNKSDFHQKTGNFDAALTMAEQSLAEQTDTLSALHPGLYQSYQAMHVVFRSRNDYKKAEKQIREALNISKALYGANALQTGEVYVDLGLIQKKRGHFNKAESNYRKGLDILKNYLGENHPSIAVGYNNLATLYRKQKKYEQSLKYHRKSLSIRKKTLGTNHPLVGNSYHNIGFMFKKRERIDSAKVYFKKAIDVRHTSYATSHPKLAQSMYQLGTIYGLEQNWEKAEQKFSNALSIQRKMLDKDDPNLVKTYFVMALVMESTDRYEESRSYYEKVLEIREEHPAEDFTNYTHTKESMARLFKKAGWESEADSLLTTLDE